MCQAPSLQFRQGGGNSIGLRAQLEKNILAGGSWESRDRAETGKERDTGRLQHHPPGPEHPQGYQATVAGEAGNFHPPSTMPPVCAPCRVLRRTRVNGDNRL